MSKYSPLLNNPGSLHTLLSVADSEDLALLADYISDNGSGRLSLSNDACKRLTACSNHKLFTPGDRSLVANEILLFGGNSIANVYRGFFKKSADNAGATATIDYAELVSDVAKKVDASFGEGASVPEIEDAILLRIFKQAFDKMPEAERKKVLEELGVTSFGALRGVGAGAVVSAALSMASLNVASSVASAVSAQVLGRAAMTSASLVGSRGLAAIAGPVGIAVATLWTLADLSSPAYRVTLPCVVQVAYMRKRYLAELYANKCPHCSHDNHAAAKFCGECGKALEAS
ncbi:ubiquinol-cytochrome C chaperone family protein [Hydrogenophaga sp. BPS33]|uniref:ubiquinol-cytochrome C chaperone family protein n=1 Tax=Hydrogenophaga sp. BPS33 TaxID=2651974 RepID=UPI00131FB0BC|nr:ubiquinol-cytochrome C chaperone family protein [Hydrogenophaga sp. BPS33]QHE87224.1 hypothetical protein F9K07_21140 [Hydrogenophaga sp. BPS33]